MTYDKFTEVIEEISIEQRVFRIQMFLEHGINPLRSHVWAQLLQSSFARLYTNKHKETDICEKFTMLIIEMIIRVALIEMITRIWRTRVFLSVS